MAINFGFGTPEVIQESGDAAPAHYSDLMGDKFTSFNPETIISGGNNALKSNVWDADIEDSNLALGYKNAGPATTPKPGRFQ